MYTYTYIHKTKQKSKPSSANTWPMTNQIIRLHLHTSQISAVITLVTQHIHSKSEYSLSRQSTVWYHWDVHAGSNGNIPRLVSRTVSAEFGSPSQDGVWLSPSDSAHWMNCSRLHFDKHTSTSTRESYTATVKTNTHLLQHVNHIQPQWILSSIYLYKYHDSRSRVRLPVMTLPGYLFLRQVTVFGG